MDHMPFSCLSDETYENLRKLNREKVIPDDVYKKFEECTRIKILESIIKEYLSINPRSSEQIYLYLHRSFFKWSFDKENRVWPNEFQSHFIWSLLLDFQGVYSREECQKKSYTDQQIQNQILPLEEIGLIFSFRTRKNAGNRTYFIISPRILHKLKNEQ
ncbi:MAG: SH viral small hydrophobic protein [Siphoviridae sp. ctjeG17]|nr:MAG: SH viral small hydrophobic protein [Siphoviridae sp. ctjeG17]